MSTTTDSTDVPARGTENGLTPVDGWSVSGFLREYWRVGVVAVMAALIAFIGSFALSPTYQATTRILIRGRDTTLLDGNGASLASQQGVVDSQLATALSDTQAALVSNRAVATRVVDDLHLDQPRAKPGGPGAKVRRGFASVYKHLRAFVTHGFYKEPDPRTAAIDGVQKGLTAAQVHTGFALDISAAADSGPLAAAIANDAAKVVVEMSNERFKRESAKYRDFLHTQVGVALANEEAARKALADFKSANGIVTTPEQDAQLSQQSADSLRSQISAAQAELDADRAQVQTVSSQLASTPEFTTTDQKITTGRSQTDVSNRTVNPVYSALLTQKQQQEAQVAAIAARLGALQGALGSATGDTGAISSQQQQLDRLQLDATIASNTRQSLATQLQNAGVNAARPTVELSRVDTASAPTYPVSPKRYLFFGVGLFMGALVGFVWSFLRSQRRLRLAAMGEADAASSNGAGRDALDLSDVETAEYPGGVAVPSRAARPLSEHDL